MTPQELEAEVLRYALRNGSDRLGLQAAHKIAQLAPALLDLWRAAERSSSAFFDSEVYHARQELTAALDRLREVQP